MLKFPTELLNEKIEKIPNGQEFRVEYSAYYDIFLFFYFHSDNYKLLIRSIPNGLYIEETDNDVKGGVELEYVSFGKNTIETMQKFVEDLASKHRLIKASIVAIGKTQSGSILAHTYTFLKGGENHD